jgi:anthranilate/para-aminobenzoate synthase component II
MLDKSKIYIIDFEDSFTFNIASELFLFEKDIQVVSHADFFSVKGFPLFLEKIKTPTAIILGPGPGSPEEYRGYFQDILEIKNNPHIYLMGICLGHQILAMMEGMSVRASMKPTHGGQIKIDFDNKNILVQRYNSLAVFESWTSSKEIQVRQWTRGISYQFHPESIGTENRPLFFADLLHFLKGKKV